MNESVNPAMVTLAREARGLTQTDLADAVGISQALLSKVEAGLSAVSAALLTALSSVLRFPEHFFRQSDQVFGAGISEFFHRKRQSVLARTLIQVHARINIQRIHVARLLRAVDVPDLNIPQLDLDEFDGDAAHVARAVRATWNLPPGPVANLTKAIEDAGAIVLTCNFETPLIDGISRWIPGMPPLFFLNGAMPADRTRLSLAHELGHYVMHRVPHPEMEKQANAFAAELLMPAADIRHQLHNATLDRYAALKPIWRVSMGALLYRAEELGCITPRTARYQWMRMGKLGYRRQEPPDLELGSEPPTLIREMLDFYREDLGYNVASLAHLLACEEQELADMYGLRPPPVEQRQQLRRIK